MARKKMFPRIARPMARGPTGRRLPVSTILPTLGASPAELASASMARLGMAPDGSNIPGFVPTTFGPQQAPIDFEDPLYSYADAQEPMSTGPYGPTDLQDVIPQPIARDSIPEATALPIMNVRRRTGTLRQSSPTRFPSARVRRGVY